MTLQKELVLSRFIGIEASRGKTLVAPPHNDPSGRPPDRRRLFNDRQQALCFAASETRCQGSRRVRLLAFVSLTTV